MVSLRTPEDRVFNCHHLQACASLPVDLISLDLAKRLPFRFKPQMVQAALARGVHFEVGPEGRYSVVSSCALESRAAPCTVTHWVFHGH